VWRGSGSGGRGRGLTWDDVDVTVLVLVDVHLGNVTHDVQLWLHLLHKNKQTNKQTHHGLGHALS